MSVFLVSTQFYDHPAVIRCSDAAIGLWVRSGSWMARHMTNGYVERDIVEKWEAVPYAAELVKNGLWCVRAPRQPRSGWTMLDWVPAARGCPPLRLWLIRRQEPRTTISGIIRDAVYARDGNRCVECEAIEDLTLDHIFPWSLGGGDTVENLRVLCRRCNASKGAKI